MVMVPLVVKEGESNALACERQATNVASSQVKEGESNALVCECQATNVTSCQQKRTLYNFVLTSMIC